MNVDIQKRTSPKISRTSVFLVILGSVFFGVLLCIYPLEAANGAANGLGCCLNILIPSLFPFMVLSVFVIQSGAANYLDRPLGSFCRLIFRQLGCRYFYEYDWRLPRRRQMRFRPAGPRRDLASASAPYALFLHQRRTGLRHYCRRCRLSA